MKSIQVGNTIEWNAIEDKGQPVRRRGVISKMGSKATLTEGCVLARVEGHPPLHVVTIRHIVSIS